MSKWITVLAAVTIVFAFTGTAMACNETSGEITKIDSAKYMLVMNKSDCCPTTAEMTFVLKKDTKVLVNGKAASLADLRAGDKVTVAYEKSDDVLSVSATRQG